MSHSRTPTPSSTDSHRPQLDTLRFVAFVGVFFFHLNESQYAYGELGVRLFFVLSGFLITRLLMRNQTDSLGHDLGVFYARRTLRIFPLYYATLVVLLLLDRLPTPMWYFTYLMNYDFFFTNVWPGRTVHFWSLCVEEQFYLLYPVILLIWPRRFRLGLLVALWLGSFIFRVVLLYLSKQNSDIEWRDYLLLPVSGEYLLWGALAAWADLYFGERKLPALRLLLLGCVLHAFASVDQYGTRLLNRLGLDFLHQTGQGIGFALVILGLWRIEPGSVRWLFTRPPSVYLGKISYGLYVFHNLLYAIKPAILPYLPLLAVVPAFVVTFFATVGLAIVSWHLFEGPINALKSYFPYNREASKAPATS
ncbi:MAG: acyltransferase [Planctomycetia bacterium]|nr:acyltransferase [Planctomycetia bacterium]